MKLGSKPVCHDNGPTVGHWMQRPGPYHVPARQCVYHPTPAANGGSICVGYPYSRLDWVVTLRISWSLTVSVQRTPGTTTARDVGVQQIEALSEARWDYTEKLDIVAADAKYGNARFLQPLQAKRRGRPRVHGERFAFKESDTWATPHDTAAFDHPHLGQVQLEHWNNLHGKLDTDVPFDVIRASTHLERANPPAPIWLGWQASSHIPQHLDIITNVIWQAHCHRWPVEPGIRFRKQRLGWNLPRFQHKETGDRWSWFGGLASLLLYLACPIVQDRPLPGQEPQTTLTPQRVQQSLVTVFEQSGSLARNSKVRGIPPGWPKGRARTPKQRFPVVRIQPNMDHTA